MKIVLYQPQIPQNTGNIGRLCVATQTELILVKPLGFQITDTQLKRSGLDYWQHLNYAVLENWEEVLAQNPKARFWLFSTKGTKSYADVRYASHDILVFGSESHGLPAELREKYPDSVVTLPMWGQTRSLNLSTSAGIALYEAYRQLGFPSISKS